MNCFVKSKTLNFRSCLCLKNLNEHYVRRSSYSTVKPCFNLKYDAVSLSNQFNRRVNSGFSKFVAVRFRCTASSYDLRCQSRSPSVLSHYHTPPLVLTPFSMYGGCWVHYSTNDNAKSSCDKTKSDRGRNDTSDGCSAFSTSEKIKCSDPLPADLAEGDVVEKKLSLVQKFKEMYRDYWYVLLPVHCLSSAVWFGGFYFLVESGVDVVSTLEYIGINENLIEPFRNGNAHAKAGYIAVAFALYKIATPLRYAVTLGGTTVAINYLKKWGYIKPMMKKEQLKAMYLEKKDILLEKKQQLKSNMFHHHLKEVESNSTTKRK